MTDKETEMHRLMSHIADDIAESLTDNLSRPTAFALFTFPYFEATHPRLFYISNTDRESVAGALQEWINHNKSEPDAWAICNSQGYWVGIWNDKETAERVMRSQPGSGDRLVPVWVASEDDPTYLELPNLKGESNDD